MTCGLALFFIILVLHILLYRLNNGFIHQVKRLFLPVSLSSNLFTLSFSLSSHLFLYHLFILSLLFSLSSNLFIFSFSLSSFYSSFFSHSPLKVNVSSNKYYTSYC